MTKAGSAICESFHRPPSFFYQSADQDPHGFGLIIYPMKLKYPKFTYININERLLFYQYYLSQDRMIIVMIRSKGGDKGIQVAFDKDKRSWKHQPNTH